MDIIFWILFDIIVLYLIYKFFCSVYKFLYNFGERILGIFGYDTNFNKKSHFYSSSEKVDWNHPNITNDWNGKAPNNDNFDYVPYNSAPEEFENVKGTESGSYRLRKSLQTRVEQDFFWKIKSAYGSQFDIYPQIHLGAIFEPRNYRYNWGEINRLNKRIDYLVVKRDSQAPILGIELDDSSHERESRRRRDMFVEDLFRSKGISFCRFNHGDYTVEEIKKRLGKTLNIF